MLTLRSKPRRHGYNAKTDAEEEKKDESLKRERAKKRLANRSALAAHLPRIEQVLKPRSTVCPGFGKAMHAIGEERAERLHKIPATIVTGRPKYGKFYEMECPGAHPETVQD
jgi:hypothetical protein